jgi:hypothetical protein
MQINRAMFVGGGLRAHNSIEPVLEVPDVAIQIALLIGGSTNDRAQHCERVPQPVAKFCGGVPLLKKPPQSPIVRFELGNTVRLTFVVHYLASLSQRINALASGVH